MAKKLSIRPILAASLRWCRDFWPVCLISSAVFYLLLIGLVRGWQSMAVWPLLAVFYILWGVFFRYYFHRRPYLDWRMLFDSLIPSTKIVLLTVLVATFIAALPVLLLFINISPEFNSSYAKLWQGDIKNPDIMLFITNVLFLLVSPQIAYRPFLAWISALIGRSGSLKFAWEKTRDNYFVFLTIALMTDCSLFLLRRIIFAYGGNDYITMLFAAPLLVYFNVVSAKVFEFFFLSAPTADKKPTA
ncbi:MAG: hypothetical protein IJ184_03525 [Alphaproteobacteria bacterium]|nr:hypothetical protein [Alphaproteobacteria bacterium]